jgi:SAM-dependent methyltransferase
MARRPGFRWSDICEAPLHDLQVRDEILYQYVQFTPGMHVLEAGPGGGYTAYRLARMVRRLVLVDIAAELVADLGAKLSGLANVECICADLAQDGLSDQLKQEFDVAFALDVLEYVVDPTMCLRNFARVLRPGGQLFLSYPNVPPPVGDGVTYFTRKAEIEDLLARAGFKQWDIFAVRMRPLPHLMFRAGHEWPLRVYRRLRRRTRPNRPQTYEGTWTFKHQDSLARYKPLLHLAWAMLEPALRLNGDVFESFPVSDPILGHQLVIRGRR